MKGKKGKEREEAAAMSSSATISSSSSSATMSSSHFAAENEEIAAEERHRRQRIERKSYVEEDAIDGKFSASKRTLKMVMIDGTSLIVANNIGIPPSALSLTRRSMPDFFLPLLICLR